MSGNGQTLFRGFGDDDWSVPDYTGSGTSTPPAASESAYTGPGSPGYNYSSGIPDYSTSYDPPPPAPSTYTGPGSPGYQYHTAESDLAATYTGNAYSDPNRNYVGSGSYTDPATGQTVATSQPTASSDFMNRSYPVTQPQAQSSGFDWGGMATGLFSGLVNIFGQRVAPPGYAPVAPPSTMPSWVLPAAIGGGALLIGAVVLMSKKSPAPATAGYRRRRRARRSRR